MGMEGFLFKVGRTFGNWHERWFVLKGKFLYGYRTERDKNYNDIIHMPGYGVEPLSDQVGFYGFRLTPPQSGEERSSTPKSLYCKAEDERDSWLRALTMAAEMDGDLNPNQDDSQPAGNISSKAAARRVASPRANPVNRHIKKKIRLDNEKKFKIMQKIMVRLEETNKKILNLTGQTQSLQNHFGNNGFNTTRDENEEKDRKIRKLEQTISQLETRLNFKNEFIENMRVKFRGQVEETKQKVRKQSMMELDMLSSQKDQQFQDLYNTGLEKDDVFRLQIDKATNKINLIKNDLDWSVNNKLEFIKNVSQEMSRMRGVILDLEEKLENPSWFF